MANFAIVREVTSSGVRLQFDGEATTSEKEYPVNQAYRPAQGDRVRVEQVGNGIVVSGAVGQPKGAIAALAAGATTAQIIEKINEIIGSL